MPLSRLCSLIEDVAHTAPEILVDDPGWLFAQRCEARWTGQHDQSPVELLLVYRSVMVRDTSSMYAPIASALLAATRVETLGGGFFSDPDMMRGRGQWLLVRMTNKTSFPEGSIPVERLREIISSSAGEAFGVMAA
ncbi:hypothetical protein CH25_gp26 [Mycobacterium phage EagleEye]|uniref:Uncharacterized protein n=1 Tax=Mycobacterium phage EagleEye TaxID=1429759 RepID=W0LNY8_9CAUD|nr:hypothetical protein CH25_gp26 [Mycobacterium phage EagleEye]AHG23860.1 hypothetical protein PBI_EAGLEEYE_80 [Mycobacterium phage EagleEye]QDK03513.1 hypothetical protein SEA_LUCYEDI_79 [Mycobacterium phage Lucyedi]QNJ55874.1 hypothetical protein SEA_PAINTERBOY_78 [Mycobacterium phage PainterBoy]